MTLGAFVTYVFVGLFQVDCSLWLLVFRTPRSSDRWKPRVRTSLVVLLHAVIILGTDILWRTLWETLWDLPFSNGGMVPVMFVLASLQTCAGMIAWIALFRPNG